MKTSHVKMQKRDRAKGISCVEFALAAPLLMLMLFGATDFARVFYHGITVANAAGVASFYGAQNNIKSVSYTEIQQMATDDATNLENVSATASLFCDCPDAPGTQVDCITGTCSDYGSPRVYSQTRVQQTFEVLFPWPLIPDTVVVTRDTYVRVQWAPRLSQTKSSFWLKRPHQGEAASQRS